MINRDDNARREGKAHTIARLALPIYALIFLEELTWVAIVPVVPIYVEKLALSKFEIGAVLAAGGFTTLLAAVPVGIVTDRLGARIVMIVSGGLLAASALGQGFAADFWSLLASRCAVGFALAGIWTAGVAWLAEAAPESRSATNVGRIVAVSGLGIILGPVFAGATADRFGLAVPFVVVGVASAAAAVALVAGSRGAPRIELVSVALSSTVRRAARQQIVVASVIAMLLLGFVGGGVYVLVPLQLHSNGLSAAEIGVALTLAATIFTVVSAAVARTGTRLVTLSVAGGAALLFGLPIVLVLASGSTAVVVAFLLIRSPFWATLNTIAYPLGIAGARQAGIGRGAAVGLLNLAWGAASVVGPLIAGALAQIAGERWAYLPFLVASLGGAAWILSVGRSGREQEQTAPPSTTTTSTRT